MSHSPTRPNSNADLSSDYNLMKNKLHDKKAKKSQLLQLLNNSTVAATNFQPELNIKLTTTHKSISNNNHDNSGSVEQLEPTHCEADFLFDSSDEEFIQQKKKEKKKRNSAESNQAAETSERDEEIGSELESSKRQKVEDNIELTAAELADLAKDDRFSQSIQLIQSVKQLRANYDDQVKALAASSVQESSPHRKSNHSLDNSANNQAAADNNDNSVGNVRRKLKLVLAGENIRLKFKVFSDQEFGFLKDGIRAAIDRKYNSAAPHSNKKLVLQFDGVKLADNNIPANLDMEDGDQIDFYFQ
jgi:hypothetical protein